MGSFRPALTARQTRKSKEITTATYQILASDHGSTLLLNRAAGMTITLPADNLFFGFTVEMIVRDTFSGTWEITCETDGDLFFGAVANVSLTATKSDQFKPNGSSNDTWKADADAKGRAMGSHVRFVLMGTNEWLVSGTVLSAGTPATAFANT